MFFYFFTLFDLSKGFGDCVGEYVYRSARSWWRWNRPSVLQVLAWRLAASGRWILPHRRLHPGRSKPRGILRQRYEMVFTSYRCRFYLQNPGLHRVQQHHLEEQVFADSIRLYIIHLREEARLAKYPLENSKCPAYWWNRVSAHGSQYRGPEVVKRDSLAVLFGLPALPYSFLSIFHRCSYSLP